MMMACRFIGLCVCVVSLGVSSVHAADAGVEFAEFEAEFGGALLTWVESKSDVLTLDEQIFTDISPLLDSPEGVRVPEEVAPTD